MGKNKWYFESENSTKQTGSAGAQSRNKRSVNLPGTFVWESPDNMPLPRLFQLVWQRFRRRWVALRFQIHRFTFGYLKPATVVKLVVLSGAGFLLLGPEDHSGFFPTSNPAGIQVSRESKLEVAEEYATPKKPRKSKPVPKPPAKPKNEVAPVSSQQILQQQSLEYIRQYHKVAIQEMKKYGVPASISLAQGLIESRAGTSTLAVNNNNHFGMKCFSKNCKKGHCSNFTDDTHKDFFKKFANPKDSWRSHSELLASGRYAKLRKYGRDYRSWARGLKAAGYATDPNYAGKIIGIIERYDLHQYDRY